MVELLGYCLNFFSSILSYLLNKTTFSSDKTSFFNRYGTETNYVSVYLLKSMDISYMYTSEADKKLRKILLPCWIKLRVWWNSQNVILCIYSCLLPDLLPNLCALRYLFHLTFMPLLLFMVLSLLISNSFNIDYQITISIELQMIVTCESLIS